MRVSLIVKNVLKPFNGTTPTAQTNKAQQFFSVKMAAHILLFVPPAIFASVGVTVTPYEVMYGNPPSLLHLRTPGCLVYYYNYTENKKNITITDERAKKGVLVGYDDVSRTYKVYSLSTRRVVRTSEAEFIEDKFPLRAPDAQLHAKMTNKTTMSFSGGKHQENNQGVLTMRKLPVAVTQPTNEDSVPQQQTVSIAS